MKFALKDVLPNPYRDLVGYRYLEYQIEKLMESIRATGYRDNIVGRILPDNKLQIAYGHHPLEALRRLYPLDSDYEFMVKDLSNDAMMQMMARENDETYGGDLRTVMQNVAAVVQALATGELSPASFRIPENTRHEKIRYAPSYTEGIEPSVNRRAHAYTVSSVASYLGYTHEDRARGVRPAQNVQAALNVLELIELGFYRKEQLNDSRYQNDRGIVKVNMSLAKPEIYAPRSRKPLPELSEKPLQQPSRCASCRSVLRSNADCSWSGNGRERRVSETI